MYHRSVHVTCRAHLILLGLIIPKISGEEYNMSRDSTLLWHKKKYCMQVPLNGIASIPNFMKVYQAVKKLLVGHTGRLVI
jgi:hypothetical protein